MTNPLAYLAALLANSKATSWTKDAMSKIKGLPKLAGSDLEKLFRAMSGSTATVTRDQVAAHHAGLSTPPVAALPPVVHSPLVSPPTAPPSGSPIYLSNGDIITVDGVPMSIQTSGRKGSAFVIDGEYHFCATPDDHWLGDGTKTVRNRSEMSGMQVSATQPYTMEYELFVYSRAWESDCQYVVGQCHGKADADDKRGEHPDIALRFDRNGVLALTVAGSAQQPLVDIPPSQTVWNGRRDDFRFDSWNTVRFDITPGANGGVKLTINGVVVCDWRGTFGYVNVRPDYWKFGIYCAQGLTADFACAYRGIKHQRG